MKIPEFERLGLVKVKFRFFSCSIYLFSLHLDYCHPVGEVWCWFWVGRLELGKNYFRTKKSSGRSNAKNGRSNARRLNSTEAVRTVI